jgi:hypothetical protein
MTLFVLVFIDITYTVSTNIVKIYILGKYLINYYFKCYLLLGFLFPFFKVGGLVFIHKRKEPNLVRC